MTKRYKLLKDLPDSKPGDIYIWNDSQKAYYKDGNVLDSYWGKESVENNPTWFQEIKEPEKIEVKNIFDMDGSYTPRCPRIIIETNYQVTRDKFPAIKQAIEFCLNNEPTDVNFGGYTFKFHEVHTDKIYTQQQMDEAIEKAFEAAREMNIPSPTDMMRLAVKYKYVKHPTLQDYLSSLKQESK